MKSANIIANDSYFPLVIQTTTWSVSYELRPVIKIKTTGSKPSEIEFLHAMQSTNILIPVAQALYIAACIVFDSNITLNKD